jgi:site-specific DNA-adenine methylase
MRYGVPYKGSKNSIAEWVYSHFPKADNFYDLFAGGCAITQVALMRQEYKRYFCNDIDGDGIKLFLNAIYGKYKNENRWIDRATFFREKDKDPYIKYCWSFGNNGRDYLYSQEIEPFKKAWHYAIYFNDFSLAEKLGLNLKPIENIQGIYERYLETKHITESMIDDINITAFQSSCRTQQLEALNRLQSLQSLQSDFSCVEVLPSSIIYCDIPYHETNAYGIQNKNNFDYERFYYWCEKQTEPLFISEYWMPEDRFECIDEIEKTVTLQSGAGNKAVEKLFIPRHQKYDKWQGTLFEGIL